MINVADFFQMQRERYRMFLRRNGLIEKLSDGSLTLDHVLKKWRFCNVFREDDKTTLWFRDNIRNPLRDKPREVILATVAFRWFNRIETGEKIKDVLLSGKWDGKTVRRRLYLEQPVVTGAYMIKSPPGMDKLEGVCWCIEQFVEHHLDTAASIWNKPSLGGQVSIEEMWEVLMMSPFLGQFMAYEVVTDLRHTCVLENAADIMTWANAGPGCTRGIGRVKAGDPHMYTATSKSDQREMLMLMAQLLGMSTNPDNWPREWPPWEMRDVEHGLCEYDKYCRGRAGEKLKRRYP